MNSLRRFTSARVDLGRSGSSLPTREVLDFQAAHALARDAVHCPLDVPGMRTELASLGLNVIPLSTAAPNRPVYLQRPDLGRILSPESRVALHGVSSELAIIVADGLSSTAIHRHAAALLKELLPLCEEWRIGPVYLIQQARVAIGDDVGQAVSAAMALVLIGERPGLSSPDSLGAYLTFHPRPGRTDAQRNCLSNIHAAGLAYTEAVRRLRWLMGEARRLGGTGIHLKEQTALNPA